MRLGRRGLVLTQVGTLAPLLEEVVGAWQAYGGQTRRRTRHDPRAHIDPTAEEHHDDVYEVRESRGAFPPARLFPRAFPH
eukprot:CAMPEP_0173325828 /NCGR_PEP_ID=MMETSP1144-20121109/733_1 /TAXON_ID=483371 /ORGANISM="non described non described, Strain CCMP2298" /LENGTH=79 /DNA_ID=CAMNT_0014270083 /DNA_START=478 /DNA_END=717 /DNA_ORIENTATION=-